MKRNDYFCSFKRKKKRKLIDIFIKIVLVKLNNLIIFERIIILTVLKGFTKLKILIFFLLLFIIILYYFFKV